jgi:hypothetical protein
MMEQLAERRMAREEDAKEQYPNSNSYMHMPNTLPPHSHHHHNHPPQLDEEEYDDEEEDEEDYDSQEYDDEDEDMVGFCYYVFEISKLICCRTP